MKLKREPLTERHKKYIDQNLDKMSATQMASSLTVTIYLVRSYLASKGVEALTPKQWNAKTNPECRGFFNVDIYKGEYTWLM